jgi:hypothetical protein
MFAFKESVIDRVTVATLGARGASEALIYPSEVAMLEKDVANP